MRLGNRRSERNRAERLGRQTHMTTHENNAGSEPAQIAQAV